MSFAVVFPGQGSQSVGMLGDLASAEPAVGETFAEAADVLGRDLWALAQRGPAEALADTRVTQPLMFVADMAVWRVVSARLGAQPSDRKPCAVAGHSLGEFAALVAADCVDFDQALRLVDTRATLMASAVPDGEGGMAALIGLDDEAVEALCRDTVAAMSAEMSVDMSVVRVLEAVNFNAPGQVAVSGHLDAIERLVAVARDRGARKAVVLPVSVPNHSSLMRAAGASLARAIDEVDWREPAFPLVQNATACVATSLDAMLETLRAHVFSPVRWTASMQALRDVHGASTIIECGPGKVLAGLGKRIDRAMPTLPVESPATLDAVLEALS